MPHIIVEYSANLAQTCDMEIVADAIYTAALTIEAFPTGGIRVRTECRDCYRIADNDPQNAFVHVMVRIGQGRSEEVCHHMAQCLFGTVQEVMEKEIKTRPLALSLELNEIDERFSFKQNTIHDRLKEPS